MTLVEGDTGVIVIDPLSSVETAQAALALDREHCATVTSAPELVVPAAVVNEDTVLWARTVPSTRE